MTSSYYNNVFHSTSMRITILFTRWRQLSMASSTFTYITAKKRPKRCILYYLQCNILLLKRFIFSHCNCFFFAEKIDFVARVSRQDAYLSAGQIVRVDSQLHFLKNIGGTLYQISYQKENRRKEDFVSRKKVQPNGVTPGKTKLWLENSQGYLVTSAAPIVNTANWIERHNVWYKENGGRV